MKTILILFCFWPCYVFGQVSGYIFGENNAPLEGASVYAVHTHKTTFTDAAGYFVLDAHLPDTLLVSYVGYVAMRVPAFSGMRVVLLKDTAALAGVTVSTGYQVLSKERATGSFDKIDAALYNREISTGALARLEGVTSGLFFSKVNGTSELYIRGISTLSANATSPLIVLDNFPYEGDLNNLNPNDIESVTVLKDAAAASIWGSRAGNGVIVITTKKAAFNAKPALSFTANTIFTAKPDVFYSRDFLDSKDFISVEKYLFSQGFYDDDLSSPQHPVISPVVEMLASGAPASDIDKLASFDVRNDYSKYLYRSAVSQQYALSYAGGNESLHYRFSGGYDGVPSAVEYDRQQRATFRSDVGIKPLKGLEISVGLQYTYAAGVADGQSPISPGSGKTALYPYARLADNNGNPLAVPRDYRASWADTTGGGLLGDWSYKPLSDIRGADNTSASHDLLLTAGVAYHVNHDLSLSVNGQLEQSLFSGREYYNASSYTARNLYNLYTFDDGPGLIHTVPAGGILDRTENRLVSYGLRGQVNYTRRFGKGELSAIAGGEIRQTRSTASSYRVYGYDDNTLTFANVDFLNSYPLWDGLGYNAVPSNLSFSDVLNRFVSVYANAAYTFGRWTVSGSVRKDASNLFGVHTNQKGVPLWSSGLAYKVSPALRFRATYGKSGNVVPGLAALPTIEYYPPNYHTNLPYALVHTLSNDDLRWEQTAMLNLGADVSLFGGRLSGSVDYYHKKSVDVIALSPVDPTLGLAFMQENTADITGQGLDLKLNAVLLKGPVRWESMLLFSYVRNKVTKYLLNGDDKGAYAGFGYSINPIEGQDPYALISYRWGGLDHTTGNPVGYVDGKQSQDYASIVNTPNWDDLVVSGTTRPPVFGNWLHTVSYKAFSLSFNIGYRFGYVFRKTSVNYTALFNQWVGNSDFTRRWQQPGDEAHTDVPSMVYPADAYRDQFYTLSEATVDKGGVVRLQDIRLGYRWKQLQFSLYASNIAILWRANKDGIDPDYGSGMPAPFSVALGITANF
ncbi:MAG TPA: SusC/RagA family TonB-linked outer membrane protein [Chitinophagaceae bacterium]|nr:SusC/RagA family TonB-linked outer membrane protein [Chitinophagaceae bacterium]